MTTCHDFTCGNHGVTGAAFDAAKHCRKCWAAATHPAVAASLKRPVLFTAKTAPRPVKITRYALCKDLGEKIDPSCACEDRRCLAGLGVVKHREQCQTCTKYVKKTTSASQADTLAPLRRTVVNLSGHFNGSLIVHGGSLLLATRKQQHTLHLSRLGDNLQPEWTRPLAVSHGADDPRLFCHRGRLHVGYAAISALGATVDTVRVRQGVAALSDNYDLVEPRVLEYGRRIEKNWAWFDYEGELHAVYSISPHRVLRISDGITTHETTNVFPWSGGYLRGGSTPVLVGDEYWCWFHGADEGRRLRSYNVGVYAFEAKPPFRVTRMSAHPLLWAKPSERTSNGGADVVFPAGAVHRSGRWLVSMGVADDHTEIAEWDHADVEKLCKRT